MKNLIDVNSNTSLINKFQAAIISKKDQKTVKGGGDIIIIDTIDY